MNHLKTKEFDSAIKIPKCLEKKEEKVRDIAATNISFLYFIERKFNFAEYYADIAVNTGGYNVNTIFNKGNCLFINSDFTISKEIYLEAIGIHADCVQSIYNLRLENMRLDLPEEASQAFEKLLTVVPNNIFVIYQIANLYEQQNEIRLSTKWFNVIATHLPTDPGILSRLGHIFSKQDDDSQGFHYQIESFQNWPVDLDVISWLGVWFVNNKMYENIIHLFEHADKIQLNEAKWRLMDTSCYRRMGDF